MDSDLFPKVLGVSLLLLAALLFFEKPSAIAGADEIDHEATNGPLLFTPWARVIVTSLAIAAYAFLLVPLGFVLASTLLSVGLTATTAIAATASTWRHRWVWCWPFTGHDTGNGCLPTHRRTAVLSRAC